MRDIVTALTGVDQIQATVDRIATEASCKRGRDLNGSFKYIRHNLPVRALALDSAAPVGSYAFERECHAASRLVCIKMRMVARSVGIDVVHADLANALLFISHGGSDAPTEDMSLWLEALSILRIILPNEQGGYKINPTSTIIRHFNLDNLGQEDD